MKKRKNLVSLALAVATALALAVPASASYPPGWYTSAANTPNMGGYENESGPALVEVPDGMRSITGIKNPNMTAVSLPKQFTEIHSDSMEQCTEIIYRGTAADLVRPFTSDSIRITTHDYEPLSKAIPVKDESGKIIAWVGGEYGAEVGGWKMTNMVERLCDPDRDELVIVPDGVYGLPWNGLNNPNMKVISLPAEINVVNSGLGIEQCTEIIYRGTLEDLIADQIKFPSLPKPIPVKDESGRIFGFVGGDFGTDLGGRYNRGIVYESSSNDNAIQVRDRSGNTIGWTVIYYNNPGNQYVVDIPAGSITLATASGNSGSSGTASSSGNDFTVSSGVLTKYNGAGGAVTIPSNVTSIGDHAFFECASLTNVTVPSSITSIGYASFYNCANLTSVSISGGLVKIGENAFRSCTNLTSVTIPSSIATIDKTAFYDCSSLKDVYYGGSAAQWKAVNIDNSHDWNRPLLNATIHFADGSTSASGTQQQPAQQPAGQTGFADVKADAWYANSVGWAVGKGITSGTGNNSFSPLDTCTQAQIVSFLHRAAGSQTVDAALPYVPKNAWAADALKWAYGKRITDSSFDENAPCTRADAVMYIWKAFGSPAAGVASANRFKDIGGYERYHYAICWAVNNGIVSGTSETTFSPAQNCDRATIVTLLYRAYNK